MNDNELHEHIVTATINPKIKMVFHFVRVLDSDIQVEGSTYGECVQKAIDMRILECTPKAIKGEVVE